MQENKIKVSNLPLKVLHKKLNITLNLAVILHGTVGSKIMGALEIIRVKKLISNAVL